MFEAPNRATDIEYGEGPMQTLLVKLTAASAAIWMLSQFPLAAEGVTFSSINVKYTIQADDHSSGSIGGSRTVSVESNQTITTKN